MSFLSSHRLHWGVHHELSDNFWMHLEQMVRDTAPTSPGTPASASSNTPESPAGRALAQGLASDSIKPQPDILGP